MGYKYADFKDWVLSEAGQRAVLLVRDNSARLGRASGVFLGSKASEPLSGDSWQRLAVIDRLVELGDLGRVLPDSDVYEIRGRLLASTR